jgi:hypothetical protein
VQVHVDPLCTYLENAGVVDAPALASALRRAHLDESSLAQLDDEDLREVLAEAKACGISVGDRAKLKALVKRTTSNHTYFTMPPQATAPPPSPRAAGAGVPPPAAAPGAPPLANRFVRTFDRLARQSLPLRQSAVDFIDRCQIDYVAPALAHESSWPRLLMLFVMAKAFGGVFGGSSRRHARSGSALACFAVGYFMRPRAVAAEPPLAATEAEAPSPAPVPPQ